MNTKDIIESGLLERFVLGQCSDQETQQILALLDTDQELQNEYALVCAGIEALAFEATVEAPTHLRDDIFALIAETPQDNVHVEAKNVTVVKPLITAFKAENSSKRYAMAAAIALLILSLIGNFYLLNEKSGLENRLALLQSERDVLADQMQIEKASFQELSETNKLLADMSTTVVPLKSMKTGEETKVRVLYNNEMKKVLLQVEKMPSLPAGKQYQLWALVDGTPVDAGVFDVLAAAQPMEMKAALGAQAFAITMEDEGGKPTPDLTQLYAMGEVK